MGYYEEVKAINDIYRRRVDELQRYYNERFNEIDQRRQAYKPEWEKVREELIKKYGEEFQEKYKDELKQIQEAWDQITQEEAEKLLKNELKVLDELKSINEARQKQIQLTQDEEMKELLKRNLEGVKKYGAKKQEEAIKKVDEYTKTEEWQKTLQKRWDKEMQPKWEKIEKGKEEIEKKYNQMLENEWKKSEYRKAEEDWARTRYDKEYELELARWEYKNRLLDLEPMDPSRQLSKNSTGYKVTRTYPDGRKFEKIYSFRPSEDYIKRDMGLFERTGVIPSENYWKQMYEAYKIPKLEERQKAIQEATQKLINDAYRERFNTTEAGYYFNPKEMKTIYSEVRIPNTIKIGLQEDKERIKEIEKEVIARIQKDREKIIEGKSGADQPTETGGWSKEGKWIDYYLGETEITKEEWEKELKKIMELLEEEAKKTSEKKEQQSLTTPIIINTQKPYKIKEIKDFDTKKINSYTIEEGIKRFKEEEEKKRALERKIITVGPAETEEDKLMDEFLEKRLKEKGYLETTDFIDAENYQKNIQLGLGRIMHGLEKSSEELKQKRDNTTGIERIGITATSIPIAYTIGYGKGLVSTAEDILPMTERGPKIPLEKTIKGTLQMPEEILSGRLAGHLLEDPTWNIPETIGQMKGVNRALNPIPIIKDGKVEFIGVNKYIIDPATEYIGRKTYLGEILDPNRIKYWISKEYPYRADKLIINEAIGRIYNRKTIENLINQKSEKLKIEMPKDPIKRTILEYGKKNDATLGGSRSIEAQGIKLSRYAKEGIESADIDLLYPNIKEANLHAKKITQILNEKFGKDRFEFKPAKENQGVINARITDTKTGNHFDIVAEKVPTRTIDGMKVLDIRRQLYKKGEALRNPERKYRSYDPIKREVLKDFTDFVDIIRGRVKENTDPKYFLKESAKDYTTYNPRTKKIEVIKEKAPREIKEVMNKINPKAKKIDIEKIVEKIEPEKTSLEYYYKIKTKPIDYYLNKYKNEKPAYYQKTYSKETPKNYEDYKKKPEKYTAEKNTYKEYNKKNEVYKSYIKYPEKSDQKYPATYKPETPYKPISYNLPKPVGEFKLTKPTYKNTTSNIIKTPTTDEKKNTREKYTPIILYGETRIPTGLYYKNIEDAIQAGAYITDTTPYRRFEIGKAITEEESEKIPYNKELLRKKFFNMPFGRIQERKIYWNDNERERIGFNVLKAYYEGRRHVG